MEYPRREGASSPDPAAPTVRPPRGGPCLLETLVFPFLIHFQALC